MFVSSKNGKVYFATSTDEQQYDDNPTSITGNNDGYWHYAVVSWNLGWKKVYVDGGLAFSAQSPTGAGEIGTDVKRFCYIGEGSESEEFDNHKRNKRFFEGDIASIRVWEKVFTDSEIEDIWRDDAVEVMGDLGRCPNSQNYPTDIGESRSNDLFAAPFKISPTPPCTAPYLRASVQSSSSMKRSRLAGRSWRMSSNLRGKLSTISWSTP